MSGATAPVDVVFRTTGLPQVQAAMRSVGAEGGASAEKWGIASRRMSGALLEIGRSGEIAGRGLKELLAGGAEMALGFGAGSALVGAVAILGAAIYEHITSRMKEARAEIRAFDTEIAGVMKGKNLLGAGDIAQRVYSGDMFAVKGEKESDEDFRNRQGGVLGLKARIAEQQQIVEAGTRANKTHTAEALQAANEIVRLNRVLDEYEARARRAAAAVGALADREGQMALQGAKLKAEHDVSNRASGYQNVSPYQIGGGAPGRFIDDILKENMERQKAGDELGIRSVKLQLPKVANLTSKESDFGKQMLANAQLIGEGFATTLADSIQSGMEAVFSHGNVFAALGKSVLSGLGSIAIQIGKESLLTLGFMQAIKEAIASFMPELGIPAAIGLIALGSAMVAGGSSSGRGGGGGAAASRYGTPSTFMGHTQTVYSDPARSASMASNLTPRAPITQNITIIGPNDPSAQRAMKLLMKKADERGNV